MAFVEALCDVDPETRQAAVEVLSKAEDHVVAECSGGSSAGLDGPVLRRFFTGTFLIQQILRFDFGSSAGPEQMRR